MRDAQRFRKVVAGAAMIASPILALASWLLWPTLTRTGTTFVTETLDIGRTRVIWSTILGAVSIALMVVAIMGVVHLLHDRLHDRRGALGSAGGGLAIVGIVLVATVYGLGFAAAEMAFGDISSTQKAALYETIANGPGYTLIAIGSIAAGLGLVALCTALIRARVVPLPSAYLLAAFGVVQVVGFALYLTPVVTASFVMLAAALMPVGFEVLTETDEAWEHPPVFVGYRMATAR